MLYEAVNHTRFILKGNGDMPERIMCLFNSLL